MTRLGKNLATVFATILLAATLSACQKPEGPAEHAGKELDRAVDNAGRQIEKAGEKIQDSARGDKR